VIQYVTKKAGQGFGAAVGFGFSTGGVKDRVTVRVKFKDGWGGV
jgi:hypothetical protein